MRKILLLLCLALSLFALQNDKDMLSGELKNGLKYYIKENNLFASIVTDTINERFFDDIGDNILECDGEDIYLIEDYKEDVLDIMERL